MLFGQRLLPKSERVMFGALFDKRECQKKKKYY